MSAATIDAHQHFWRLSRGDYDWLTPDLEVLYRDFEPADLAPLLKRAGVERSVASDLATLRFRKWYHQHQRELAEAEAAHGASSKVR